MGIRGILMWASLTVIMNCVVITCFFLDRLTQFTALSTATVVISNNQEQMFDLDDLERVKWQEELIEDLFTNKEPFQQELVADPESHFENHPVVVEPELEGRFLRRDPNGSTDENAPPKMVLVMTQSRHGSTWLMDMLGYRDQAIPVFEPLNHPEFLNMYSKSDDIKREGLARGYDPQVYSDWREVFLARICICDWDGIGIPGKNGDIYGTIRGLWYKDKLIYPNNPELSNEFKYRDQCFEEDTMMVPKTIRYYDLSALRRIIDFGCDRFKVVHLVRDPRAVMLSRMTVFQELFDGNGVLGDRMMDYKKSQYGYDEDYMTQAAEHLCSHHLDNYKLGMDPPPWLRGRYKMVRYEDLAGDADYWSKELLDFIGVEYTEDYRKYVYDITHESEVDKQKDWYGVRRQSSKMVDSWRDKLIEAHWRTIERACGEMMRVFNYEITF